jgi:transcription elongation factor GreA
MRKTQLTKQGLEKLREELEDLIKNKRPKIVDRLQKARAMGDLSENSEYSGAKEELDLIERQIVEMKAILENAEVIESSNNKQSVNIGSTVLVEVNGVKDEYTIVGEFEANPLEKKLSHISPIGKALLGKKVGDEVEIEVPAGKVRYKVIAIK